jgi:hypothetical protein
VALSVVTLLVAMSALTATGWSSGSGGSTFAGFASSKPNIVLILTDDQRWDTLWAMPHVRTLLGRHGMTFRNAFVTTALCCPSRASILTGKTSRHTGVYQNVPPHGGAPAFRDTSTIATWLHGAGYTTGYVGKYLNAYWLTSGHIPPGWDEWDAITSQPTIKYYDYEMNENGRFVEYGEGTENYSTNVLEGLASRFLRTAEPPFFRWTTGDSGRFRPCPLRRSTSRTCRTSRGPGSILPSPRLRWPRTTPSGGIPWRRCRRSIGPSPPSCGCSPNATCSTTR